MIQAAVKYCLSDNRQRLAVTSGGGWLEREKRLTVKEDEFAKGLSGAPFLIKPQTRPPEQEDFPFWNNRRVRNTRTQDMKEGISVDVSSRERELEEVVDGNEEERHLLSMGGRVVA
jgi:hypothetical protein